MTVHIGLIGAGNISDTHARAIAGIPGAVVSAVTAPTRAHADDLAARHGATAYDTVAAFLDHRPMDMVVVGSPSGMHGEHGMAAARRGLHVLVEKPIEISAARADALIAEAARAGVTLGVIFQDRVKPDVARLHALVDSGALGKPILATALIKWYRPNTYYRDSRWRGTRALDGGGALINQAIHTVDLLLWCFGAVRRVYGRTATRLHAIEVEDTAVAVLEFTSGALATVEATTAAYPGYARRLEVTGSEGTVILDGDRLVAIDLREGAGRHMGRPLHSVEGDATTRLSVGADPSVRLSSVPANASSPVVADVSAHRRVVEDFIGAMSGRTSPCCDGISGRASVAVIEAIYRSSALQVPVEVG